MRAAASNERGEHQLEAEAAEPWFEAYATALDEVGEAVAGVATDDLYHAWLDTLIELALHEQSETMPAFTDSDAWADRELYSALAGYAQLKHDAILYAFEDMSVECDGMTQYLFFTEQPVLPTPRSYVDPEPETFRRLSALANRMYETFGFDPAGAYRPGTWDDLLLTDFVDQLADMAGREAAGEDLTEEDHRLLMDTGGLLEAYFLGPVMDEGAATDSERQEIGVALVASIHSNPMREQALQVGIGRLLDLYVAVPAPIGRTLTQGASYSFYEFTGPIDERLTDGEWGELVAEDDLPDPPDWTRSFIEWDWEP